MTERAAGRGNPFLEEGARIYFSKAVILHTYLVPIALAGLALLVWWPRESMVAALRAGGSPDSFAAAAIGLYVALVYLGARYGTEAYAPDSVQRLQEYVTLTPAPLRAILPGKIGFALLHTLFLLALSAPLLLASLAVSGLDGRAVLEAMLVIGAATLAVRMYGLALLVLFDARRGWRDATLVLGVLAFFCASIGLLPPANPVIALVSVSTRGVSPGLPPLCAGVPYFWFSVILDVVAAGLLALVAFGKLAAARRRAARLRGGGQAGQL